ncbi:MAG: inositol monophosphatase [Bacteroidetes bacterium]|jgi:myo-inositol-1(or 4)-monophosphatase|nr:inositol monophosphatase [Bacteroidota bacterium]
MTPSASSSHLTAARDAAVDAARRAGRLIRQHAGTVNQASVREKGIHDLVTVVDEQVQQQIVEDLNAALPEAAILAEEGDEHSQESTDTANRWIVDPIDGTTNFAHGVPPYAVSIALEHDAQIVVGVVYDAARDDLFTAIRGEGAYANGVRMAVSRRNALNDCLLTTGFPYRSFGHIDAYLDVLKAFFQKTRGVRRPGVASVDLAYVAWGRFDAFFETGLSPWDVAAGMLLVEEAGGMVTDYRNDPSPVFARQILASNGLIHPEMLEALRPMQDVTL